MPCEPGSYEIIIREVLIIAGVSFAGGVGATLLFLAWWFEV